MLDDFINSLRASQGGNLQMPVMGDPLRYINPYYTRQQSGDGLAPMQAYQSLMQGRPMPQMRGWTPYQAPRMPTIGIDTAVKPMAQPAGGLIGGYIDAGGFGGHGGGFDGHDGGMGGASSAGMGGATEGSAGSTAATASSPDGPDGSNASAGDGGGSK